MSFTLYLGENYGIIHVNPLESHNFEFVATIPAYSVDGAYMTSQNGCTDLPWIQNYQGLEAKPCRSTSVGDIIFDGEIYWRVKGIGFEKTDNPFPMNEI